MLTSFILFVVASFALGIMIGYRIWELRAGRLSAGNQKLPDLHSVIDMLEERFAILVQQGGVLLLHVIGYIISRLVLLYRDVRDSLGKRVHELLRDLPHYPKEGETQEATSFFLRDIARDKEEYQKKNGNGGPALPE